MVSLQIVKRDVDIAKNGVGRSNVKFTAAVSGTGGLNLNLFKNYRKLNQDRNIILIPKVLKRTC